MSYLRHGALVIASDAPCLEEPQNHVRLFGRFHPKENLIEIIRGRCTPYCIFDFQVSKSFSENLKFNNPYLS